MINAPSPVFVIISWAGLAAGVAAFLIGLWNSLLPRNEQGFFFTVLMYGLFAAVAVQKSVRDKAEGVRVNQMFYGISWFSAILAVLLLALGVFNAELALSEKGFYVMSYLLALFGAITVQKNARDLEQFAQLQDKPGNAPEPTQDQTDHPEAL